MRWVAVIYSPNRWGPIKVFGPFDDDNAAAAWRRENRIQGHLELAPIWTPDGYDPWTQTELEVPE